MKAFKYLLVISVLLVTVDLKAQIEFDQFFIDKTLRIDYYHIGNVDSDYVEIANYKIDPYWSRGYDNLIEPFDYGDYRMLLYHYETSELIFTQSYNCLFDEWQSSKSAGKEFKSFEESVQFPFPKQKAGKSTR